MLGNGNNSSTGGYLSDISDPSPLEDDELLNVFQVAVAAITDLDPTLVRPSWQAQPPTQPSADTNWCAIAVSTYIPTDFPVFLHDGVKQVDNVFFLEQLDFRAFFYGPRSFRYASILRAGLYVPQNFWGLSVYGIKLHSADQITNVTELINSQYISRADLTASFTRMIQRTYAVENILGAEVVVTTDDGHGFTSIISEN